MTVSLSMVVGLTGAEDNDTAWLLSVASPDERALSLYNRGAVQDGAIGRCAAIINDTDVGVYRRGLAVLAMGRTLENELRIPQPRDAVSIGNIRQVPAASCIEVPVAFKIPRTE